MLPKSGKREKEKPADKFSGDNFVYCLKSRTCKGRCSLNLLCSESRAENVIPEPEAAISQL